MKMRAPGRVGAQLQRRDRLLELHGLGVVVLRLGHLQRAAHRLVALAPQLDGVGAEREVRRSRCGPRRVPGSRPFARTASAYSGASVPLVVALSWPSSQISTPAGSVTKNRLAAVRSRSTSSVSVGAGAMLTVRVSVW